MARVKNFKSKFYLAGAILPFVALKKVDHFTPGNN